MTAGGSAKVTSPLLDDAFALATKLPAPIVIKLAHVIKLAASLPARFEINFLIRVSLNDETTLFRLWSG